MDSTGRTAPDPRGGDRAPHRFFWLEPPVRVFKGGLGRAALVMWAGWSDVQVGRHVRC